MMNLMMDLLYAYVGVLCICGKGTLEMDSIITYLNLEWWFSPPPPPRNFILQVTLWIREDERLPSAITRSHSLFEPWFGHNI